MKVEIDIQEMIRSSPQLDIRVINEDGTTSAEYGHIMMLEYKPLITIASEKNMKILPFLAWREDTVLNWKQALELRKEVAELRSIATLRKELLDSLDAAAQATTYHTYLLFWTRAMNPDSHAPLTRIRVDNVKSMFFPQDDTIELIVNTLQFGTAIRQGKVHDFGRIVGNNRFGMPTTKIVVYLDSRCKKMLTACPL